MKGRMKLRQDYPFAGDTIIYLQPKEDASVKTMGVDRLSNLFYAPAFVTMIGFMSVVAVLIHEVLHLLLRHPFRVPKEVQAAFDSGYMTPRLLLLHKAFNWAADLKINFMFYEMGADLLKALPGDCLKIGRAHV